jgi:general secretion pathway protein H
MPAVCDSRGFTLIELVVVMVLISTLTAFALPRISGSLFADQLKTTARRFMGIVAEAGSEARARRTRVTLRYDPGAHVFTTAPVAGTVREEHKRRYPTIKVPDGVQVVDIVSAHGGEDADGRLYIAFSPLGYVDKTIVHLRNDDGDELSIALSPFLGVTRILEGNVSLDDDRYILGN